MNCEKCKWKLTNTDEKNWCLLFYTKLNDCNRFLETYEQIKENK